jgi:D-alanyl-D-alanine carboxypeptidase (penicillin-binding protein 5/6)
MVRLLRVLSFFLVSCLAVAAGRTEAQAGYAHFIYDVSAGKILASENGDVLNHPASLTKMMTLYLTFEAIKSGRMTWDEQIVMTPNAASKIPFKLGLKPGETLSVREAVLATGIRSANDSAAALGDRLGGSEERFATMMTAKARALGMSKTVFRNASGLPDPAQITTARDMAILALSLIRDYPSEYQLFSMRSFVFRGRTIRGHNNLMYRYPGMDGIKTGFVNASGYNLASAVVVNGKRYIGVVMGGKSARKRDDQMAALLDQYTNPMRPAGGALVATAEPQKRPGFQPGGQAGAPAAGQVLSYAEQPRRQISPGMASSSQRTVAASAGGRTQSRTGVEPPVPLPSARVADASSAASQVDAASNAAGWSIQVAAAGSRRAATAMLERALPVLAGGFGPAAPSVEGYKDGAREYFRARFVGFASREVAASACASLQAKSMTCFVVR